jgi:hypothetical protein
MRGDRVLLRAARFLPGKVPRLFSAERTSPRGAVARRFAIAAVTLAVLLAVPAPFQAAEKAGPPTSPAPSPPKVTVTVLVIQTSPNKGSIDPQLKDIAEKLKGAVAFESLKLISRLSKTGSYGEALDFSLPDAMEFQVTPVGERAGTVTVHCVLLRPDPKEPGKKKLLLNSTLRGPRGQGLAPIAGPALKDLVLVVAAE